LLLGSGYSSIQTIELLENRNLALHEQHLTSTRLVDEVQGEEAGLSGIFYAIVAGPRPLDRQTLLNRLEEVERNVDQTMAAVPATSSARSWSTFHVAVRQFIIETRWLLSSQSGAPLPPSLFRAHEVLMNELSSLTAANLEAEIEKGRQEALSGRQRLRQALVLLGIALLFSVVCAVSTVLVAAHVFSRLAWQSRELSRLSRHVLDTQEQILHRFSRELHDEFGQTLTAIEANLAAVPRASSDVASRVEDCLLLVKDAMGNVRELAQIMRPSMLDDFGLRSSLQFLGETFAQRTGIEVEQRLEFDGRLPGETETHLYRIAQEALTNISRHSGATKVRLALQQRGQILCLSVADNGGGLKPNSRDGGLGLIGMRERMRASGGDLDIRSARSGLTVTAEVPLNGTQQPTTNPSFAGG
jgi:signal transduction histidine kinase